MKKLLIYTLLLSFNANANTILHIGDSHSAGPFGRMLSSELYKKNGDNVYFYGSCGSIARWFFKEINTTCGFLKFENGALTKTDSGATPNITTLIKNLKPDIISVELGTNYFGYTDEYAINDMKALMVEINNSIAKCIWITPPDMRKFRDQLPRFKKLILAATESKCTIVESDTVTTYPDLGGDGVHYSNSDLIKTWVDLVIANF